MAINAVVASRISLANAIEVIRQSIALGCTGSDKDDKIDSKLQYAKTRITNKLIREAVKNDK